jgi:uncharacterized protein YegL
MQFTTVAKVSTNSNYGFNEFGMLEQSQSEERFRIGAIHLQGQEIELDDGSSQINLFLVLDNSGSMGMTYKGMEVLTKNQQVLNTLTNLVAYLNDNKKVGNCNVHVEIQSFSDTCNILLPLTKMTGLNPEEYAQLLASFDEVKKTMVPVGSTNIEMPLKMYYERFRGVASQTTDNEDLDRLNKLIANPCVPRDEKAAACKSLYEKLSATVDVAVAEKTDEKKDKDIRNYFLMMTDGEPNQGDLKMSRVKARYTCPDTTYYFVGYGKDHSSSVMSDLDQQSGNYMAITEDEHAGFVVGDILTRILCPCVEQVKITSLDENVELFDAISNTWCSSYHFATLEGGKQMTFYFRFKTDEVVCQPQFTISAIDTKTKTPVSMHCISEDDQQETFDLETFLRIHSLQLLSVIHAKNQEAGHPRQGVFHLTHGFQRAPTTRPFKTFPQLFKECEAFLVVLKTETGKLVGAMDDETIRLSRKLEDLESAITMVMLTMNSCDRRCSVFSTILLNEWFCHSLRVSTVYAADYTTARNGGPSGGDHPVQYPEQCILGRQFSSDISPRALETCRGLSANSGVDESQIFLTTSEVLEEEEEEQQQQVLKRGRV